MGAVDVARSTSTTAYGWMIGIWWSVEETKKKWKKLLSKHIGEYI